MTKASDNKFPKLIVQEAANDGSVFSNPDADYRVLFLGEDGSLHLKDSAGAVTAVGGGLADQGAFTYLDATEAAAPGTPASGTVRIYAKADGRVYSKDDGGTEYGPFDAAGAGTGDPTKGANWCRFPMVIVATASVGYNSIQNATDGVVANVASATSASFPQDFVLHLVMARKVGHAEFVFPDAAHSSKDGSLDWSDDGTSWTTAHSWTGDTATSRSYDFTETTHAWWRVHTTAPGTGGSGINFSEIRLMPAGTDYARGLTPTSNQSYTNIAYATDGDEGTRAQATATGSGDTFVVDLGAAHSISSLVMAFYDVSHAQAAAGRLQYSSDGSTWTDLVSYVFGAHYLIYVLNFAATSAQYWRVIRDTGGLNGLDYSLFQLWG